MRIYLNLRKSIVKVRLNLVVQNSFTVQNIDILIPVLFAKHGALKTQVQHFVGENVAWEKVTTGALKTQVQHFVGENVAWEKVTTN